MWRGALRSVTRMVLSNVGATMNGPNSTVMEGESLQRQSRDRRQNSRSAKEDAFMENPQFVQEQCFRNDCKIVGDSLRKARTTAGMSC